MKNRSRKQKFLIFGFLIFFTLFGIFFEFPSKAGETNFDLNLPELIIVKGNTLMPISNPNNPEPKVVKRLKVIVTAYSSSPWQTDNDPYITAAGTRVREGIVANNFLPMGTKIRIPEIFGEKIFVVEDRMSWKKGNYQIDVWFEDYLKAKEFGAKITYIEILES